MSGKGVCELRDDGVTVKVISGKCSLWHVLLAWGVPGTAVVVSREQLDSLVVE